MTRQLNILVPALALSVSACGAAQVPAKEVSEADAAIRAAVEVGAEQYPQAALHLKMARDEAARKNKRENRPRVEVAPTLARSRPP